MANQPTPQQTVAAILNAQNKPLDYAQARVQAQAAKEQAALQAASRALVAQLQGGVQQAAPLYDAAVNQTTELARQAAGLLAGANPNSQVQADLTAVGAPLEQQAQLAGQLGSGFGGQGAVLNVMQGSIPGASLVAQKAAEQGVLAGLPTVAALQGQQNLRALLARSAESRDKYVTDRLGVAGQAASLLPQLRQQLVENQQSNRSFGLQQRQVADAERQDRISAMWTQRKFDADEAYRASQLKADEAAARAKATGDAQDRFDANYWKNEANKRDKERLQIDRQKAAATGLDPKTGLTKYEKAQIGLAQQRINISKRKSSAGTKGTSGLTANRVQELTAQANKGAAQAANGFSTQDKTAIYASTTPGDPKGWSEEQEAPDGTKFVVNHHPPIGYQKALQQARQAGIPLSLIQPALNAYYERGKRGRPRLSFAERGGPKAEANRRAKGQSVRQETNQVLRRRKTK